MGNQCRGPRFGHRCIKITDIRLVHLLNALVNIIFENTNLVVSVAQRKWTRLKTMRPRVRIPVKNFEIWTCVFQWEKQFLIVFTALRGPGLAPTPSSDICERHMLVTWYQIGWWPNQNIGLRMLWVAGVGAGTSQVSRVTVLVMAVDLYRRWRGSIS